MNIAEILKNLPKGAKLYSPAFGDVIFEEIRQDYIKVKINNIIREFYSDGKYYANGECMLFPSRENRDWNTFNICPFKKGDILVTITKAPFIYNGFEDDDYYGSICGAFSFGGMICGVPSNKWTSKIGVRKATEKEANMFLKKLKRLGIVWDPETFTITKSKFDIEELKPFDKVLARDNDNNEWGCEFYSHYRTNIPYHKHVCSSGSYHQCIPYNDETEHLVGKTSDCPEYYKTW